MNVYVADRPDGLSVRRRATRRDLCHVYGALTFQVSPCETLVLRGVLLCVLSRYVPFEELRLR